MNEQEIKDLLNQILKDLFFRILRLQAKSVSQSTNDAISRTEMHILETIQNTPNATLTHIADSLGITKATTSVSITRLVEKNHLEKVKSETDKRKSIIKLTEKGRFCCKKHQQFHDALVQSLLKEFHIDQHTDVLKSLQALLDFFNKLEK